MIFLIIIVFLLIGGLVTFIAANNLTPSIHLTVLSWHTPDLPVGAWLIAAFLFGAIVLYLVAVFSALGDRRKMKGLRQQIDALQEQVTAMSQTSSAIGRLTAEDRLSLANTGPLTPDVNTGPLTPGVNAPQSGERIPFSSLASIQNFRQ